METGTVHHLVKNPPPESSLAEVLNAARAAVDQEFQISQLLDAKARGLATLGAQWFGIAQAVAAVAFATHNTRTWMLLSVGIVALAGGVALGVLFFFCWRVWSMRTQPGVSPAGLLQMRDVALAEPSPIKLVDHYAATLAKRREANGSRADALECAQIAWFFAMFVPFIELGLALATRLAA